MGENIYRIRKKLGLTRLQFAERCDISEGYLATVENGAKGMRIDTLMKICHGAGVSPDFLLKGEEADDEQMLLEFTSQLTKAEQKQALNLIVTYLNSLHELGVKQ